MCQCCLVVTEFSQSMKIWKGQRITNAEFLGMEKSWELSLKSHAKVNTECFLFLLMIISKICLCAFKMCLNKKGSSKHMTGEVRIIQDSPITFINFHSKYNYSSGVKRIK